MSRRRAGPPGPVYAIADARVLSPCPLPEAVEAMAEAGIRWIQIRAKTLPDDELYRAVEASLERLGRGGHGEVSLWIDDRADLAALLPVLGVHVGQRDLPPAAARRVVGDGVWIGASTHDERELHAAAADPEVDVVAVGPIYQTTGKPDPDPVVGLDFLRRARQVTGKLLVAIGGIDAERLPEVLAAGADTAAVLGAVCGRDASEVSARARSLVTAGGAA